MFRLGALWILPLKMRFAIFFAVGILLVGGDTTYSATDRSRPSNDLALSGSMMADSSGEARPGLPEASYTAVPSDIKANAGVVQGVDNTAWTTVNLTQSYASMVVVTTPNFYLGLSQITKLDTL